MCECARRPQGRVFWIEVLVFEAGCVGGCLAADTKGRSHEGQR